MRFVRRRDPPGVRRTETSSYEFNRLLIVVPAPRLDHAPSTLSPTCPSWARLHHPCKIELLVSPATRQVGPMSEPRTTACSRMTVPGPTCTGPTNTAPERTRAFASIQIHRLPHPTPHRDQPWHPSRWTGASPSTWTPEGTAVEVMSATRRLKACGANPKDPKGHPTSVP